MYKYSSFSLSIRLLLDTWIVHILAIVNNAAVNEHGSLQILFQILISIPLDMEPGVRSLDRMVVLVLIF